MLMTPMLELGAWDRRSARSLRLVWVTQLRSCPPSKCNAAGPQAKVLPACAHLGKSAPQLPLSRLKSLRGNSSCPMYIVLSLVTTDLKGSGLDWELEWLAVESRNDFRASKARLCVTPGPVPGEDRLPRTHRQKAGKESDLQHQLWGILIKGSSGQNPLSFQTGRQKQ